MAALSWHRVDVNFGVLFAENSAQTILMLKKAYMNNPIGQNYV